MRTVLRIIDAISDQTGRVVCWLCPVFILVVTNEVVMRFVFNNPTMWGYETGIIIGASLCILAWSYAQRHQAHVRVTIFYSLLSIRGQAIIDVFSGLFLSIPLFGIFTYTSVKWAVHAWAVNERMVQTYWHPPFGPLRTIVAIGALLMLLQTIANFIRDLYTLIRNERYDD